MRKTDKDTNFTLLTGEVKYIGEMGAFHTGDGNFTLNGELMEKQTEYYLKDGDIINDLNFKPPTPEDLKWEFN